MSYSIQNIIQEYNQKLQNTWQTPKTKRGGIPCPGQQLKDFFIEFAPGECYVFAGSQHYMALEHFRAWLLWHLIHQSINIGIRGHRISPQEDFQWLLSLESGHSFHSLSSLENASIEQQKNIHKAIQALSTLELEWYRAKTPIYPNTQDIFFFSLSLQEWRTEHCFTLPKLAKRLRKPIFVFVYMDKQRDNALGNPYYLNLDDLSNEDNCIFSSEYGDYIGFIYPSWPMWKRSWLESNISDITLNLQDLRQVRQRFCEFQIDNMQRLVDYNICE